MSRFVNNRRALLSLSAVAVLLGNTLVIAPQTACAEDSWSALLKPLVKDVLVPGAKLGLKKWTERKNKKDGSSEAATDSTASANGASAPPAGWDAPPPDASWTSDSTVSAATGSNDVVQPTPDGPSESQTIAHGGDSDVSPPPPPPPAP